mgnify:CR=1 FL=1
MKIAILGWGSLLWDCRPEFDEQRGQWQIEGPVLRLEFSRISKSRDGALTLVIDEQYGQLCQVAYALSKRKRPEDAIADLRSREGTTVANIGAFYVHAKNKQTRSPDALAAIDLWATLNSLDVVVWTSLESNFSAKNRIGVGLSFSVENAICHLQALSPAARAKAAEYVSRSPDFIDTPLRRALQSEPWFITST